MSFYRFNLVAAKSTTVKQLIASWAVERDNEILPILADAMQDIGYNNIYVLSAFRAAVPTLTMICDLESVVCPIELDQQSIFILFEDYQIRRTVVESVKYIVPGNWYCYCHNTTWLRLVFNDGAPYIQTSPNLYNLLARSNSEALEALYAANIEQNFIRYILEERDI